MLRKSGGRNSLFSHAWNLKFEREAKRNKQAINKSSSNNMGIEKGGGGADTEIHFGFGRGIS